MRGRKILSVRWRGITSIIHFQSYISPHPTQFTAELHHHRYIVRRIMIGSGWLFLIKQNIIPPPLLETTITSVIRGSTVLGPKD